MKKTILTLVLYSLFRLAAKAQITDTVFYFTDKGAHANSATGAWYKRVIKPPLGTENFYDVREYYMDGKIKRIGNADPDSPGLQFGDIIWHGKYTAWYPNGQLNVTAIFKDGWPDGEITSYYPNGKIYCVEHYKKRKNIDLVACYDTLGTAITQNGNGHWIYYYRDMKKVRLEGTVKNGRQDGLWEGRIIDSIHITSVKKFVYEFDQWDFRSAYGYDTNGTRHSFKREFEPPQYKGDIFNLINRIKKNLKSDKPLDYHKLIATFIVEKDGTLSNIAAEGTDDTTLIKSLVTLVAQNKRWIAGKYVGVIMRYRVHLPLAEPKKTIPSKIDYETDLLPE